ncbi:hypothetical protein C9374_011703 [Naegleria lovaniensis]|uniref:MIR domain-containing protein n=1 Tax=Naegleria lovaniensis TaxID=51637 RepID=A0AA88KD28_NAELO|nr:uncharacterized protein C9374_011703 [Naegleria lovaniensis]KAG2373818.1 hypothetical protein C9374_011703 [Naegleria lovaniensis]
MSSTTSGSNASDSSSFIDYASLFHHQCFLAQEIPPQQQEHSSDPSHNFTQNSFLLDGDVSQQQVGHRHHHPYEFLRIGDCISLYTDLSSGGTSIAGFLSVDGINLNCSESIKGNKKYVRCGLIEATQYGTINPNSSNSSSSSGSQFFVPNFEQCVFQICHPKSYSARKGFHQFKENLEIKLASGKKKAHQNEASNSSEISSQLHQLEQRMEREFQQNKLEAERNLGRPVLYGQAVQLFHMQTQSYLTVARESAEMQKDCMRLGLDKEGSTYSYFEILPYSSFQQDGENVKLSDQIRLFNRKSNQFIHLSYYRFNMSDEESGVIHHHHQNETVSYSEIALAAVKSSKNKNKYSYDTRREVNVSNSTAFTRWRFRLFSSYAHSSITNIVNERYLKVGDIVRIFHKELDGYLTVNDQTGRVKLLKKPVNVLESGFNKDDLDTTSQQNMSNGSNSGVNGSDNSSSSSPNNYLTVQTLWRIEYLDPSRSSIVKWSSLFRLRHIASGKYMIIRPIRGITLETDDTIEERFEKDLTLATDSGVTVQATPRRTSVLHSMTTPRTSRAGGLASLVQDNLWTVHVESHDQILCQEFPCSVFQFTDSTGGKKGKKVQTNDYFRLKHPSTDSWIHVSRPSSHSTYQRVTSTTKMFEQDVFHFSKVSQSELDDVLTVSSYIPIMSYFKSKLQDDLIEKSDIKLYINVLSSAIRFCTISEETDPLVRSGIPVRNRQNIIKELGIISIVMDVITILLKKQITIDDLAMIYEKPEKLIYFDIIQYSFRLVRQAVIGNESNGLYMAQYINFIQTLIEHSISASEALLEILSNNYTLLNMITNDQIDFFVKLLYEIPTSGTLSKISGVKGSKGLKKAVYLSFLTSLIICEGKTVYKNQRYISDLLFVTYKDHMRKVFIVPKISYNGTVVIEVNHDEMDLISFTKSATDTNYPGYSRPNYEQLVFFQEEIKLFAALCTGRNEDIESTRKSVVSLFTYDVVCKCISEEKLTAAIRTSFVKLLLQCFVDTEKRETRPLIEYTRKITALHQKSQDTPSSELKEVKEFLQTFLSDKENFELDVAFDKKDHNIFVLSLMSLCKRMVEVGVLTIADFEEGTLAKALFDTLRGDNDKKNGVPLTEEERIIQSEENIAVMKIKIEIANIFHMLLDIRLDKRVTSFLQFFWKKYREEEIETVLKDYDFYLVDTKEAQQKRKEFKTVVQDIDSKEHVMLQEVLKPDLIFTRMDKFDIQLLSLTRYHNHELATTCLSLLIRKYRAAQELSETLPKIELIVSREMAKSYDQLSQRIADLRSVFGYGQGNYIGVRRITDQEEKKVLKSLDEITSDLVKNGHRSQRIIRNLSVQDIIFSFLKKDWIVSSEIQEKGIELLTSFVSNNSDNQKILFPHMQFFMELLGENRTLDGKIVRLLCEMVKNNRALCSTVEEKHIEFYIDEIAQQRCAFMLTFLHVVLGTTGGNPIKRNQTLITKHLLERKKDVMILFKDEEGLRERNNRIMKGEHNTEPDGILNYHIALLYLLAALADGKNRESEQKLQTLFSYEELLEQACSPYTLPVLRNPLMKVIDEIYLNVEKLSDEESGTKSKINVNHPLLFKLFSKMIRELEVLEITNTFGIDTPPSSGHAVSPSHVRTPTTPSKFISNPAALLTPSKSKLTTSAKRSSKTYSTAVTKITPMEEDQELYRVDNYYLFEVMIPFIRDYFHLHFPPPNVSKEQLDIAEDLLLKIIDLHKHTINPEHRERVHKCITAMLKKSMTSTSQRAISHFLSSKASKAKIQRNRIQTTASTEKDERIHETYKKYLNTRIISKILKRSNFTDLGLLFLKYDGFIKVLVTVLLELNNLGFNNTNLQVGLFGMEILKNIVSQQHSGSIAKLDLVEKQVPEVVIELIKSPHHRIVKSTIELAVLILSEGDIQVQHRINKLLTENDSSDFFTSVRDRIRLSKLEIKERKNYLKKKREKEFALSNQRQAKKEDTAQDNIEGTTNTNEDFVEKGFIFNMMEFLRLLCEGHNTQNQLLLQHQPRNRTSIDLISEIVDYLVALEKKLDSDNVDIAVQGFKTLIEFVQGPAAFNQDLVGTSRKIYPRLINEIMSKSYDDSKLTKQQELELKKQITLLLISLLEGRNKTTLEFMKASIHLDDFEHLLLYISRLLQSLSGTSGDRDDCEELLELQKRMRRDFGTHYLYNFDRSSKNPILVDDYMESNMEVLRVQFEDLGMHIFFLLSMLKDTENELLGKANSTSLSTMVQTMDEEYRKRRVSNFFQNNSKEVSFFQQRSGSIEVLRDNSIEKAYFPKPTICNNIIDKARSNYVQSLHVMTPQEKVRKLYNDTFSRFYVEMCHYESMKNQQIIPSTHSDATASDDEDESDHIEDNLETGVLLPSMSLVAAKALQKKRKKKKSNQAKTATWEYIANYWDYFRFALFFLSVAINVILLASYKRIYSTDAASEIPVPGDTFDIIAKTKTTAPRSLASDIVLVIVGVIQLIYLVCLFIIYAKLFLTLEVKKRFKLKRNETWDSIPVNREFIVKCFIYTLKDSQIWFFATYILVSILGLLIHPICYSIQLFECVFLFKSLTDVLKSVTTNWRRLFFTGMLLSIALFFFGTLYFSFFSQDFVTSKTSTKTCEDMLSCYVTMLDYGFRGESFWEDIYPVNNSVQRAILDLAFLLLVVVLLTNVVFGVILDSFEVLRNEREDRKKDIKDKCFICGLERTKFDTKANEGITFEKHVKEEHYLWNYVYFLIYLYQKPITEYTGTEQYIYERCEDNDDINSFFPIFRSLSLEQSEQLQQTLKSAVATASATKIELSSMDMSKKAGTR